MINLPSYSINVNLKSKNNQIAKIITTLCFYISLFLLLINDWVNAGLDDDDGRRIITLLGMVFAVVSTFLLDGESRKSLLGKVSLFYGFALLIYTFMGWAIWSNDIKSIIKDLSAFGAVYAGFALFRLIIKSYHPKFQLLSLVFFVTVVLFYNYYLEGIRLKITNFGIDKRLQVYGVGGPYRGFLDIINGISIGILCRIGWGWSILVWGLLSVRAYCALFFLASKGGTISIIVLVILSCLVLGYKLSNGILETQSSIFNPQRLTLVFLGIGIILAVFVFSNFNFGDVFENLLITKRFSDSDTTTSDLRIEEAASGLKSMQDLDWILGRGMGANYERSFQDRDGRSIFTTFHIGIFSFLIKGGIILFTVCTYFLFIKFPLLFYKALLTPNALDPKKRTALLLVLPGIFAWSFSLLTSGHLTPIFCLPLGFAFGAYSHIRKYGLCI